MHQSIFMGLWWLYHNGVDANQHVSKLIKAGRTVGLLGAIRRLAALECRGVTEAIAGRALLGVINKGKQRKLAVRSAA